ncbi:selenium metabolism membrane protein YedE/FdhT [Helicobacter sp. MIT 14-3879]|uniref:selenium metabolism membrane protein YedE/FdhT n=1 Tax=Helicobacter sp. MIT 14-3879 TaxID=2040649 RepID=UPI000E1EC8E6|nr:selenium metabolism membrane protein YedE/FdhT [Helicobacter sp. MIT 14-3879]RDU65605.1 YeeE/YedE family protein [Helicobacter sp. MIT 14-3879]
MWNEFKDKYLIKFYKPFPAVIALAILSTYYFGFFGSVWAVTGEMTRWGGEFLELFGMDLSKYEYYKITNLSGTPLSRNDGIMLIGMFLGCFIAALWANNVRLRMPASNIRIAQALIGGILSGFGARLAMGCNLANFFTGLPYFSIHTWVFVVFMIVGIYLGSKIVALPFLQSKATLVKTNTAIRLNKNTKREKYLFCLGSIIFALCIIWVIYLSFTGTQGKKPIVLLGLALSFGLCFGFLISRAQICFTSAFRDLFLTGRSEMAKAIFIGMMVSSIGAFSYIMLGNGIKMVWIGPNVAIGGFLFGLGIVLAGGCECGWMYRAVEGQVHYWIVGIGNIIGTIILALTWDYYANIIATPFPKMNLLEVFGNYGGVVVNYILLTMMLCLIILYSKKVLNKATSIKCAC